MQFLVSAVALLTNNYIFLTELEMKTADLEHLKGLFDGVPCIWFYLDTHKGDAQVILPTAPPKKKNKKKAMIIFEILA